MDIVKKVEEVIAHITKDPEFAESFKKDPVAALEKATHLDLPNEQLEAVAEAVKAKMSGGKEGLSGLVEGAEGFLGGLFKKK